jgi:D-3-phosphoglycerate dehydrogenase
MRRVVIGELRLAAEHRRRRAELHPDGAAPDAIALVGVDQDPGEALVTKIRALPNVKEARTLRF